MSARYRVLLAVFVAFHPGVALGYYDKVHSYLVKLAAELIEKQDSERLYEELYTPDYLMQMGRGSWREDNDPPVDGNERAMRHYYDPDAQVDPRLKPPLKGVPYHAYFPFWSILEGSPVTPPKQGRAYLGAADWAFDGEGNRFSWNCALKTYAWGTVDAKREAYFQLGHVLHLLGDAAEPDHAANVPHPGSGLYLPDSIDDRLVGFVVSLLRSAIVDRSGLTERERDSLRTALLPVEVALRTEVRRTFLEHLEQRYGTRPLRLTGFEGIFEDSVEPALVRDFFLPDEQPRVPPRVQALRPLVLQPKGPVRHGSFHAYFDVQARSSKRRQEASGLPMALGCEDLRPLLLDSASDLLDFVAECLIGSGEREVAQYVSMAGKLSLVEWDVMKKPIYLLPTINEHDERQVQPHRELGEALLTEAIEHIAGLMQDFHDIVNEPPYVQHVRIVQNEDRYEALWKQSPDATYVPSGRTEEAYKGARLPDDLVLKGFRASNKRAAITQENDSFRIGQPARIEITFGPLLSEGSLQIAERIDPQSVNVQIGGRRVAGSMTGPNTWAGEFLPEVPEGEDDADLPVVIEARDLHRHYPRHQSDQFPAQGYRLDADPRTVACPSGAGPDYPWQWYEVGPDRNHKIHVIAEAAAEFREVRMVGESKAADSQQRVEIEMETDGSFSGTLSKTTKQASKYWTTTTTIRGQFEGHAKKTGQHAAQLFIDQGTYEFTEETIRSSGSKLRTENGSLELPFPPGFVYLKMLNSYSTDGQFRLRPTGGGPAALVIAWEANEVTPPRD